MNPNFEEVSERIKTLESLREEKIKDIDQEINDLYKLRKEICPHNNIKYSPSKTFYEYCERPDYYPATIICNNCGLIVSQGDDEYRNNYEIRKIFNRFEN